MAEIQEIQLPRRHHHGAALQDYGPVDQAPAYRLMDRGPVDLSGLRLNQTDPHGSDVHTNRRVDEIRL